MRVFAKGDRVSQLQYGTGTVTEANERHTVIDFDEHGIRTFSTPIVMLERTTVAAPVKTRKSSRSRRSRPSEA
ncbi:MAG TPA: hypothetical protein VNK41_02825 [Vicinamibacterales bacterium]|nr:hypothetical protein [Vicinamibacterales bacterium]